MSWFTPIPLTHHDLTHDLVDDPRAARGLRLAGGAMAPVVSTASAASLAAGGASLGTAHAASQWSWATAPAAAPSAVKPASQGASLRAPVELLARMAQMASATGRSESEVWIEAAREWLLRRRSEPNPAPVAPAQMSASAPVTPGRRSVRVWEEIDALLIELRAPVGAQRASEGAPAA